MYPSDLSDPRVSLTRQIAPRFIDGLIDLIKQNFENMELSNGQKSTFTSTSALSEPEGNVREHIVKQFERTLAHIKTRKADEESDHWAAIQAA